MDCVFCNLNRSTLRETDHCLAFFDGFPVSPGHTLIIPKRHVRLLWEMTADEYVDAFALVRDVQRVLQDQFNPDAFNLGVKLRKEDARGLQNPAWSRSEPMFR